MGIKDVLRRLTRRHQSVEETIREITNVVSKQESEGTKVSGTFFLIFNNNSSSNVRQTSFEVFTCKTNRVRGLAAQVPRLAATSSSTTIDARTYDHGERMTGSSYHNGVSESRTYNTDNTLATISHTGATIGNLTCAWDDNENKTSETITGTMSGYGFTIPTGGYDAEDRLVTYNRTDTNLDQSWNLSLVGDWNSITTEGTVQSRTHDPSHELLTGGGQNVSTDVKGNITLIPAALRSGTSSLALTWDFDNRLSIADYVAGTSPTYRYVRLLHRRACNPLPALRLQ